MEVENKGFSKKTKSKKDKGTLVTGIMIKEWTDAIQVLTDKMGLRLYVMCEALFETGINSERTLSEIHH